MRSRIAALTRARKINHTMFDTGLLAPMYSWRRSRCPYCCLTTIFNPPICALATCVGRLCLTVARVHVPPLPTTVVVWDAGYSETKLLYTGGLVVNTHVTASSPSHLTQNHAGVACCCPIPRPQRRNPGPVPVSFIRRATCLPRNPPIPADP